MKNVAGTLFLLFLVNVSCFAGWYVINHPLTKEELSEDVIRIGVPIDPTHYSGQHTKWGVEMAVDEINAEGGVNVGGDRKELVLVIEDTEEMSPDVGVERTVSAITKLITTEKVNVVIGGGFATYMPAVETCARYKTIYFPTGSSELPTTQCVIANYEKYKYIFNPNGNSTHLGMEMVKFYTWLRDTYGFTKVAIIAEEYVWCDPIIEYFKAHTPEGMEIVYKVRFPSTVTTFMPYLTKAKDAGAQVLMGTIALDWGITYLKEWKSMEYGLSTGLVLVAERSTCWEETDGGCKYHCEIIEGIPVSNMTEKSYKFYQGYIQRYGQHPMFSASLAYIATYAYAEAVERAGTLDTDAVIAALEEIDMITPSGRLKWSKTSHSPYPSIEQFAQWQDFEYRPSVWASPERFEYDGYVSEPIAYTTLELPPWMK